MGKIDITQILQHVMIVIKKYVDDIIPTEDEILEMLSEEDIIQPIADKSGSIITDANGDIFIL